MKKKISPELEKEVLRLAAQGMSTREISAWIKVERGLDISFQRVADALKGTREERGEVARAVTRDALAGHVTRDLDRLEESLDEIRKRKKRATDTALASLVNAEAKLLDLKTKLSGAQETRSATPGAAAVVVDAETLRRMAAQITGDR